MIGILIVTHGRLAEELLAAGRVIAGELPNFRALALEWADDLESAGRKIAAAITDLDQGEGVLVLTDMFGDTPSNATLALRDRFRIEIISGVNLPMVVRLGCSRTATQSLAETARWLEVKGRRSICRATGEPSPPSGEEPTGDD